MTTLFRALLGDSSARYALVVTGVLFFAIALGSFVISADGSKPDPVAFEQTTATGIGGEERQEIHDRGLHIPRVQVFYSQYEFIVGYRGVGHAVDSFQQEGHEQQFGYPVAVYVSDFSGTEPRVTEKGYINTETDPGWVDAQDATFVLGTERQDPGDETVVPFASRTEAQSFADANGGELYDWKAIQDHDFDIEDASAVRERVEDQHRTADERLDAVRPLADRDVSVVVGEDEPTIQAAINAAANDSTVLVPPGTYEENVTVDRPVTLRGENATVDGGGVGNVIEVTHDDVAVLGLELVGVGENLDANESVTGEEWDQDIELSYGHGDAAIEAGGVTDLYIADLEIDTPTNGILLRDSERTAVEDVEIQGSEEWTEGFMGVLAMRSPTVIQDSFVEDGRDGVYLHRSHDTIIRGNKFVGNRFGVHLMFTSETLIANNVARQQTSAGITIMTDPAQNAVVGNDVRNASSGVLPSGTRSYFAENVLVNNGRGLMTSADQSLYERNVIAKNEMGVRASSIRPSNRVVRNDFIDNDRTILAGSGPLRIWTHQGVGNYWSALADRHEMPARYTPTDPMDGKTHSVAGAETLAASPAATALDTVRDMTPGLRDGAVLDTAPQPDPFHPGVVADIREEQDE